MILSKFLKPALAVALVGGISLAASADPGNRHHRRERHGNYNSGYTQNYERHGNGYVPSPNTYQNGYSNGYYGNYGQPYGVNGGYSAPYPYNYNNGYYPNGYPNQNGYYRPNVGAGIINGMINSGLLNRLIR